VIAYKIVLLPVIAFYHSNVALRERWDRWLRSVTISPNIHRVHHSDWQPETAVSKARRSGDKDGDTDGGHPASFGRVTRSHPPRAVR
jgi:hypothetical protein